MNWSLESLREAGVASPRDAENWIISAGLRPEEISDHDLPRVIAWCRDEQEAKSRRYGAGAITVIPLRSGRFGLFGDSRGAFLGITEGAGLLEAILRASKEAEAKNAQRGEQERQRREAAKSPKIQITDLSLEDIGL